MDGTTTPSAEFPATSGPSGLPRPSLAAHIRDLALREPGQPAIFFRDGWDWRWWTWAEVAAALDRAPEVVAAGAHSGASGAGTTVGDEVQALAALAVVDDAGGSEAGRRPEKELDPSAAGAGVPPPAATTPWRRWLGVAAREVVVVEAPPGRTPERLAWLRWAVAKGAALVLAPTPASWLDVVLFARPSVLWGGAEEAAALLARLRGRRRQIDRLRAFGWVDRGAAAREVASGFAALGVTLVSFSARPESVSDPD